MQLLPTPHACLAHTHARACGEVQLARARAFTQMPAIHTAQATSNVGRLSCIFENYNIKHTDGARVVPAQCAAGAKRCSHYIDHTHARARLAPQISPGGWDLVHLARSRVFSQATTLLYMLSRRALGLCFLLPRRKHRARRTDE